MQVVPTVAACSDDEVVPETRHGVERCTSRARAATHRLQSAFGCKLNGLQTVVGITLQMASQLFVCAGISDTQRSRHSVEQAFRVSWFS